MGRTIPRWPGEFRRHSGGPVRRLLRLLARLFQPGAPGVTVLARFGGSERRVRADRGGYFRVHMRPARVPTAVRQWHPMELRLDGPGVPSGDPVRAEVYVPPESARYAVISDIDDTVMYTGVANKLKMFWRLFAQDAETRVAFPGVAALYRAFHAGRSGADFNPLLYVSRGPWTIYPALDDFFHMHRIPVGPILFLRDWGLRPTRPIPRRARGHKRALIRRMMSLYSDLPFILIGDSGQRDPEVYAEAVRDYPGRVAAVYIRDVNRENRRSDAIGELARRVTEAGSVLVLAADSFAMAEHAADLGFIARSAPAEVRRERRDRIDPETPVRPGGVPTKIRGNSPAPERPG